MNAADSRHPSANAAFPWFPFALVLFALGLHWVKLWVPGMTFLPNLAPWMALAFTGTLVFPRKLPWWLWAVLPFVVDFAAQGMGMWQWADGSWEVFLTYGCYAAAAGLAYLMRGKAGILQALLGVAAFSIAFYLITNTLCWWVKVEYSKDLAGWVQALTTGLPGYPPVWMFLRNSLLSDLGFSAALILAFNAEARLRSSSRMPLIPWIGGAHRASVAA